MNINLLQQKNPCAVGERIGRYAEVDAPMSQVRYENLHGSIKS
jgi:hypothetical protein